MTEELKKKNAKKQPDYVVEVKHTKDDEPEDLEDELTRIKKQKEELELIVEVEATKAFEDEKEAFLNLIPDEERRNELDEKIGDDPEVLQEYQRMTSFLASALRGSGVKVTGLPEEDEKDSYSPSGRARLPQNNQGAGAESYKQYIDELYSILQDPEKTAKERKIADGKINQLFLSMISGIKSRGGRNENMPYLPTTSGCPNCGNTLIGDIETCNKCGWKMYPRKGAMRE